MHTKLRDNILHLWCGKIKVKRKLWLRKTEEIRKRKIFQSIAWKVWRHRNYTEVVVKVHKQCIVGFFAEKGNKCRWYESYYELMSREFKLNNSIDTSEQNKREGRTIKSRQEGVLKKYELSLRTTHYLKYQVKPTSLKTQAFGVFSLYFLNSFVCSPGLIQTL